MKASKPKTPATKPMRQRVAPKAKAPEPLPELQVTRNCGHCGAAKHVFPSKLDETPCDLCGNIHWV